MFTTVGFMLCAFFCFLSASGVSGRRGQKPEFIDKEASKNYKVSVGKIVRFKCDFLNWQKRWKMTWYVNGKLIQGKKNNRYRIRNGKSSRLRIRKVKKEDAGLYKCVASNKYGSVSRRLNLIVVGEVKPAGLPGKGPPWFTKPTHTSQQFLAWPALTDIKIRCPADGEPPLRFQWLKNGKINKYRRLDPKFNSTKWYLRIKTAVPSDNGLYKCIVSNRLGNISQEFKLQVIEKGLVRPILSASFPVNKTAKVGENVTFQCIELFSPTLTDYRWLHWNKLPPTYPDLNLESKDAFPVNSSYYSLINHKQYTPFAVNKTEGKHGGRVILYNVTKEDEGFYTCLISNHIGKASRSAFLKILSPGSTTKSLHEVPRKSTPTAAPTCLLGIPKPYHVDVGKNVVMNCDVLIREEELGHSSTLLWFKDGKSVRSTKRIAAKRIMPNSLTISDAKKEDAGWYKCTVLNKFGSVSLEFKLLVGTETKTLG